MQRLPDLLLTKIAFDLFLAGESKLSGQAFVADEFCDGFSERCYITKGEKKAGLTIHQEVYDSGRRRVYDGFSGVLCLQEERAYPRSLALHAQDISTLVVRSRVVPCPP